MQRPTKKSERTTADDSTHSDSAAIARKKATASSSDIAQIMLFAVVLVCVFASGYVCGASYGFPGTGSAATKNDGPPPPKFQWEGLTDDEVAAGYGILEWARENGAVFDKVTLAATPTECCGVVRGVMAKEVIEDNEVFLTLPERLTMSLRVAKQYSDIADILTELEADGVEERPLLVLHLLYEASLGDASFYAPFVRVLRSIRTNMAVYQSEDFISQQSAMYQHHARGLKVAFETDYSALFPRVFEEFPYVFNETVAEWYTMGVAVWAWAATTSRYFGLNDTEDQELITFLYPVGDMLNHGDPHTYINYNLEKKTVAMTAGQRYEIGDEVFNNYGSTRCQEDMLAAYGFFPDTADPCQ